MKTKWFTGLCIKQKTAFIGFFLILTSFSILSFFFFYDYLRILKTSLKFVFLLLLILFIALNVLDLRHYDSSRFLKESKNNSICLWTVYYDKKKPYRLKEFLYDSRFVYNYVKFYWYLLPPLLIFVFFMTSAYVFYLATALPLIFFNFICLSSLIFTCLITNRSISIDPHSDIQYISDLRSLAYFLFILNPATFAFAICYLIILKPIKIKTDKRLLFENMLFSRIFGKSKWFINLLVTFSQEIPKFLKKEVWGRKKLNYRIIRHNVFNFINDFLLINCSKTYFLMNTCKIIVIDRKITLNAGEGANLLLGVLSKCILSRGNKLLLRPLKANVGGKWHAGLGFPLYKEGEIASTSIETFRPFFSVEGKKFKTIEFDPQDPFQFPAQAEEFKSGEFGDFIYGATQYVTHTLVEKNAIVGETVKIDEKPLKIIENKIFCIETLKWVKTLLKIKEANYEITKFSYTENARFAPNPYVWGMLNKNLTEAEIAEKKFILQYRKPGESRIISQSEVGERLGVVERDFFDEMKELGAEIEFALTGESVYERVATIEAVILKLDGLSNGDFFDLMLKPENDE